MAKSLTEHDAIAQFWEFSLGNDNVASILEQSCRTCCEVLDANSSQIFIPDRKSGRLTVVAEHGGYTKITGKECDGQDHLDVQRRALQSGKPEWTQLPYLRDSNIQNHKSRNGILLVANMAIKQNGKIAYLLEIHRTTKAMFKLSELEALEHFSEIVSRSLDSAGKTFVLRQSLTKYRRLAREQKAVILKKNILADELHHRVRNNLQIVHGMLVNRLDEIGSVEDSSGLSLRKIASRVMAMAHVYDQLIGASDDSGISLIRYFNELIKEITKIYGSLRPAVTLVKAIDEIELDLDRASTLGLIATELLTNAYTHAFPDGRGHIQLTMVNHRTTKSLRLTVADDGAGFDHNRSTKRNGMKLVRMLVEQLAGKLTVTSGAGSNFVIDFPA